MRKFAGEGNGFMNSMMNMYDEIRANLHFNKFVVGGAAFRRVQVPDRARSRRPSDNFIRDVVREVSGQLSIRHDGGALRKGAIIVNGDVILAAYFQSMLAYFTGTAKPAETLLRLKLKELIVSLFTRELSRSSAGLNLRYNGACCR